MIIFARLDMNSSVIRRKVEKANSITTSSPQSNLFAQHFVLNHTRSKLEEGQLQDAAILARKIWVNI